LEQEYIATGGDKRRRLGIHIISKDVGSEQLSAEAIDVSVFVFI